MSSSTMCGPSLKLHRNQKRMLISGFIRINEPKGILPDPLQNLCLLYYDVMHYIDLSGKKLQEWFNTDTGEWTADSTTFRYFTRYSPRKLLAYRLLCCCDHGGDKSSRMAIQIAVPPEIKEVNVYAEIYLNDTLVTKGNKRFESGISNCWKSGPKQLLNENVKKMESVSFRYYIEFLRIIPKEEDEDKNKVFLSFDGIMIEPKASIDPSLDCRLIRMRKKDTMEWVVPSSMLLEMEHAPQGKCIYSPNFGHDGNWCFVCEPYLKLPYPTAYIKFGLLMMKMPAKFEFVTMSLQGTITVDVYDEECIDGKGKVTQKTGKMRSGHATFKRNGGASQTIIISTNLSRVFSQITFRMTIEMVSYRDIDGWNMIQCTLVEDLY